MINSKKYLQNKFENYLKAFLAFVFLREKKAYNFADFNNYSTRNN